MGSTVRSGRGPSAANGQEFPTPRTDELVVFEDYFYQGLGVPIHSFLHGLIDYYRISLCNLNPNSILHVAIFINFCEAYLGILPHFDLFRHFFCLKIWGGDPDLGLLVVHIYSFRMGWRVNTSPSCSTLMSSTGHRSGFTSGKWSYMWHVT